MTTKIKFVTDSVADIPPDLVEKWNITVVPCFVNFGGKSYADDGVDLVREEYYARLGDLPDVPTTSAMSPDFARSFIEPAFEDADHLVIVTTPAKLSGIYNAMRLASIDLPADRVTLMEGGTVSIGLGMQVLCGAEVAAETGDLQTTLTVMESVRLNLKTYCAFDTMTYLRRGGRVGWAAAGIGTLLNIKPLVEVGDGEVHAVARVRTFTRALDKLVELARAQAPFDRVGLLHINNEPGLMDLRDRLGDLMPEYIITGSICPAVGTHIGPGAVGIVTLREGWRNAIST